MAHRILWKTLARAYDHQNALWRGLTPDTQRARTCSEWESRQLCCSLFFEQDVRPRGRLSGRVQEIHASVLRALGELKDVHAPERRARHVNGLRGYLEGDLLVPVLAIRVLRI